MTDKLNVTPAPGPITITGDIDGIPVLFESTCEYWHAYDPAPDDDTIGWIAAGNGGTFTIDEAVALFRALVHAHRRANPPPLPAEVVPSKPPSAPGAGDEERASTD